MTLNNSFHFLFHCPYMTRYITMWAHLFGQSVFANPCLRHWSTYLGAYRNTLENDHAQSILGPSIQKTCKMLLKNNPVTPVGLEVAAHLPKRGDYNGLRRFRALGFRMCPPEIEYRDLLQPSRKLQTGNDRITVTVVRT